MRIRYPGSEKFGSGMAKPKVGSGNRDKHPGSATLMFRASDCQWRSRNSPGFDPIILRTQWNIWGAADEAVLKIQYIEEKNTQKIPLFNSYRTWSLCKYRARDRVLWIRIRSERHYFGGYGSTAGHPGPANMNPDPDPASAKCKAKLKVFFYRKTRKMTPIHSTDCGIGSINRQISAKCRYGSIPFPMEQQIWIQASQWNWIQICILALKRWMALDDLWVSLGLDLKETYNIF